jgi:hypothetical protein
MGRLIGCAYCGRRIFWSSRRGAYELWCETLDEERAREDAGEKRPQPRRHICPRRPPAAPVRTRKATPEELRRIREGYWRPDS